MDINKKNELQTHQGMDLKHMQKQKVSSSDKNSIGRPLSIKIVIDDRLSCTVNKVYMYMILVMSIYAFLIAMGLFIKSSPKQIIFFTMEGHHKVQILTSVSLLSFMLHVCMILCTKY